MNLLTWMKMDLQENLLIQRHGITEIHPETRQKTVQPLPKQRNVKWQ